MRKQIVGAREMVFLISPVRGRRADLTGEMNVGRVKSSGLSCRFILKWGKLRFA